MIRPEPGVIEAPQGTLWIGTDEGLRSLNLDALETRFVAFEGRSEDVINEI